jgi:hypothetical protein
MGAGLRRCACTLIALALFCGTATPQVIEFESGGLRYKTLTKSGFTVMFAVLPSHIRHWSVLQVSVSNGSSIAWSIKPEDFTWQKQDGGSIQGSDAGEVVDSLLEKASRGDVIRLVTTYEGGIYGNVRLRSTNGYEARRRDALAEVSSAKLKAAAAASAIVLVSTRLSPGQSTDGAVFLANSGKVLAPGRLVVHAAAETFEFESSGAAVSAR